MTIRVIIFLGLAAFALESAIRVPKVAAANPKHLTTVPKVTTTNPKYLTTTQRVEVEWIEPRVIPLPIRKIRSSDKGAVGVNVNHNDKSGTTDTINAKQNIISSSDGKLNLDATVSLSKNFDHGNSNQNIGLLFSNKGSPHEGTVGVNVNHNDKFGTTGSFNANQNIWTSSDGTTKLNAGAGFAKNFDHGNSDTNLGIVLSKTW